MPLAETGNNITAISGQTATHTFGIAYARRERLAVKLVCVTHHLLLQCDRCRGYLRHFQAVRTEIRLRQPCSGMTFTKRGQVLQMKVSQQRSTQAAVKQIGFRTTTMDVRSVSEEYADIMKHGAVEQKRLVKMQLRMTPRHIQSTTCHLPTVDKQRAPQGVVFRIKRVNDA